MYSQYPWSAFQEASRRRSDAEIARQVEGLLVQSLELARRLRAGANEQVAYVDYAKAG